MSTVAQRCTAIPPSPSLAATGLPDRGSSSSLVPNHHHQYHNHLHRSQIIRMKIIRMIGAARARSCLAYISDVSTLMEVSRKCLGSD